MTRPLHPHKLSVVATHTRHPDTIGLQETGRSAHGPILDGFWTRRGSFGPFGPESWTNHGPRLGMVGCTNNRSTP